MGKQRNVPCRVNPDRERVVWRLDKAAQLELFWCGVAPIIDNINFDLALICD